MENDGFNWKGQLNDISELPHDAEHGDCWLIENHREGAHVWDANEKRWLTYQDMAVYPGDEFNLAVAREMIKRAGFKPHNTFECWRTDDLYVILEKQQDSQETSAIMTIASATKINSQIPKILYSGSLPSTYEHFESILDGARLLISGDRGRIFDAE